jgi:hypothetical protein
MPEEKLPIYLTDLTFEILGKYGVDRKNPAEFFVDIVSGKVPFELKLVKLVTDRAALKISFNDFVLGLEEEVGFPKEKAEKIAKELEERVIPLIQKESKAILMKSEEKEIKEEAKKEEKKPSFDIYREPIE